MSKDGLSLGNKGEELAANLLQDKGYKILYRNYKSQLGEIDIIAKEKEVICFIEVKTRSSDRFGSGSEAVAHTKQRKIAKAALCFLKEKRFLDRPARFDVVSLDYSSSEPKLDLIKDAFELNGSFFY